LRTGALPEGLPGLVVLGACALAGFFVAAGFTAFLCTAALTGLPAGFAALALGLVLLALLDAPEVFAGALDFVAMDQPFLPQNC